MTWTDKDIAQYTAFLRKQEAEFDVLYNRFGYRDLDRIIDMIDYALDGCYDKHYVSHLFTEARNQEITINV